MSTPAPEEAIKSLLAHSQQTLKKAGVQPGEMQYHVVMGQAVKRIARMLDLDVEFVHSVRQQVEA